MHVSCKIFFAKHIFLYKLHCFQLKFTTYYKFSQVYRKVLFDFDLDVCDTFRYDQKNNYTSLPMTHTNLLGCPIGGYVFGDNLDCQFAYYPSIMQSGSWRFDFALYTRLKGKKTNMGTISIFVDLNYIGDIKQKVH